MFLTGGMPAALACSAYAGQSSFTLRQLQEFAARNSPDPKNLEQKLNAVYAAASQQGRWANPEFETTIDGDEQDLTLRQPVDLWGKRLLARRVGNADATVSAARLESTRYDLRFQVAQQFLGVSNRVGRFARC